MNGHSQNQFLMPSNGLGINPNVGLNQGIQSASNGCGSCSGACQCAGNQATLNAAGLSMNPLGADQFQNNGLGLSGMMGQGVSGSSMDMGISGSTLNLMAQISSMMATVMTGLMSFLTQLMSGSGASTGSTTSGLMSSGGGTSLQSLVDQSANLPRTRAEEARNEADTPEVEEPASNPSGNTNASGSANIEPIAAGRNPDGSNVRATQTLEDYKERFGVSNLGIWGDEAHQRRKSDHNTGDAVDLGVSSIEQGDSVVDALVREADARGIKYIIFNNKIWSTARRDEGWRNYTGSNPHTGHAHVSFYA